MKKRREKNITVPWKFILPNNPNCFPKENRVHKIRLLGILTQLCLYNSYISISSQYLIFWQLRDIGDFALSAWPNNKYAMRLREKIAKREKTWNSYKLKGADFHFLMRTVKSTMTSTCNSKYHKNHRMAWVQQEYIFFFFHPRLFLTYCFNTVDTL